VSLNRLVFKRHLKVRMFSHSRMSAGRVPGGWSTEQQRKKRDRLVRCLCEERQASGHRKSSEPEVVHGSLPLCHSTVHCSSPAWK